MGSIQVKKCFNTGLFILEGIGGWIGPSGNGKPKLVREVLSFGNMQTRLSFHTHTQYIHTKAFIQLHASNPKAKNKWTKF